MLLRSLFTLSALLALLFLVFARAERSNVAPSRHPKSKFPALIDEEASQWLSTRNVPSRWRRPHTNHASNELDKSFKQLQSLNDNGIRQFDTQSFEGVSMEVIFEMVYKPQDPASTRY